MINITEFHTNPAKTHLQINLPNAMQRIYNCLYNTATSVRGHDHAAQTHSARPQQVCLSLFSMLCQQSLI